jgi:hypothetical protein
LFLICAIGIVHVENDIRKMGIVNWKEVVQDRDGWKRETRVALILLG